MSIWDILGIRETTDKEAIQSAYRQKLAVTNPEDSPEAFMELRRALEQAIEYAETPDAETGQGEEEEPQWDDSPLGLWMQQVDQVYRCFSKRIDREEWKRLLDCPVCQNLDTRLKARNMLLDYLLDHIFLPQSVISLLDEHFSLQENIHELEEEYPQRFLEVVITESVKRREYPPYEYLKGDDSLPFDQYLWLNSQLMDCIGSGDTEKAEEILSQMVETGIESPFLVIEKAKLLCQQEDFEQARRLIDGLFPQYENLKDARLMRGDLFFFQENIPGARQEYQWAVEQEPRSQWARYGLAKCMVKEGRYEEANEIFCTLLEEDPYDTGSEEWLRECNRLHIEELERQFESEPDLQSRDQETVMKLAWCYYQNEQFQAVIDLLSPIEPQQVYRIQYSSLMGRSLLYLEQEQKALDYLEEWEELLRQLTDQGEDGQRKREQMPYVLLLKSGIYSMQGKKKEALALMDQLLADDPKNREALGQKGQILYDMWELEQAADAFTKAIELNRENHLNYLMRAESLYRLEYYGQAFDDCQRALEIYPYEFTAYRCKIKILLAAGEIDAAEETMAYLEGEGLSGSEIQLLKGRIAAAKGNKKETEAIYKKLIAGWKKNKPLSENSFELPHLAEVYYQMALLELDGAEDDFGPVIEWIDQGIEQSPAWAPLLELKAEIACQCGRYEEALSLCKEVLKIAPGKVGVYGMMDSICRAMEQWEDALKYADLQLQQAPSGYAYMRRGQILTCLDRTKEAWEDFQKASELDPEQAYIYNYMGVILEFENQEREALAHYLKAIQLGEEQEEPCEEAYGNASNIYCRMKQFTRAAEILQQLYERTEEPKYLYQQIEPLRMGRMFTQAEEKLEDYREAEGFSDKDFPYVWERAHIYRDIGNFEKALELYLYGGKTEPGALREAGKILLARGDYKEALKVFTKAISMLDGEHQLTEEEFLHGEYYIWAAKTCLNLGKKRAAHRFARQAAGKIPKDFKTRLSTCLPMVYQMLGGICAILGDYEKAEQALTEAFRIRRCDYCNYDCCIDALYEMGYLLEQQGRDREALECYKKGIKAAPADADLACGAARLEAKSEKGKK